MAVIDFFDRKQDTSAQMRLFEENGNRVFYVRFYETELEEDFIETIILLRERDSKLKMSKQDGTYRLEAPGPMSILSTSAWDILMHRYWSLAHEVRQDKQTGEKYCPVLLANTHIEPCERRVVG